MQLFKLASLAVLAGVSILSTVFLTMFAPHLLAIVAIGVAANVLWEE